MTSYEYSGALPDYNNERSRQDLLGVVTAGLKTDLVTADLAPSVKDNAYVTLAVFEQNPDVVEGLAYHITDPLKRLTTMASAAHRLENTELKTTVIRAVPIALGTPEERDGQSIIRHDKAYLGWIKVSVALGDPELLMQLTSVIFRDEALGSFALAKDDFSVLEKMKTSHRERITRDLIFSTDQDISHWHHLLPDYPDDLLTRRIKWRIDQDKVQRGDVTVATFIESALLQAHVLLDIAAAIHDERAVDWGILELLRVPDEYPSWSIRVDELKRYMDITGDEEALADLGEIVYDLTVDLESRIGALAAIVGRTGNRGLAEQAEILITDLYRERQKKGHVVSTNKVWADIALGLDDQSYALRITSAPLRQETLLKIALKTESVDPVLSAETREERGILMAQYYIETDDLESAQRIDDNPSAREQAIIGIALRRGEPQIAGRLVSAEAQSVVIDELLRPESDVVVSVDTLEDLFEAGHLTTNDCLKFLKRCYQAGDAEIADDLIETLEAARKAGYRFDELLKIAEVTGDVKYVYRALHDLWYDAPPSYCNKLTWGLYILNVIQKYSKTSTAN